MKIFVTGATGFIGAHLCQHLSRQGHELWALCRSRQKFDELKLPANPVEGALSTDPQSPNQWVDQLPEDLDAVVHLAGMAFTYRDEEFAEVNVEGSRRLVADLKQRHSRLRLVYVSSLAAAGPSASGRCEAEAPQPVSSYGRSKLAAEQALSEEAPGDWKLVMVRPAIVIGPRDQGMLDMFVMVKRRVCVYPGCPAPRAGRKLFSFVSVGDLVRLLERCLTAPQQQRETTYFAAYPEPVSFAVLMGGIKRALGVRRAVRIGVPLVGLRLGALVGKTCSRVGLPASKLTPDKVREASAPGWYCSSQRSIDELGFEYQDPLDAALGAAAEDYRQRGWI